MEPAVAMVAAVQRGEAVAGCWGEEVEAASCSLEEAADLEGNQTGVNYEGKSNYTTSSRRRNDNVLKINSDKCVSFNLIVGITLPILNMLRAQFICYREISSMRGSLTK